MAQGHEVSLEKCVFSKRLTDNGKFLKLKKVQKTSPHRLEA